VLLATHAISTTRRRWVVLTVTPICAVVSRRGLRSVFPRSSISRGSALPTMTGILLLHFPVIPFPLSASLLLFLPFFQFLLTSFALLLFIILIVASFFLGLVAILVRLLVLSAAWFFTRII
jgi:hypothetical protein